MSVPASAMLEAYSPAAPPDRITHPDRLRRARQRFLDERPAALESLLRSRYEWMNGPLAGRRRVVELGAGLGLSREFIRHPGLILTDVADHPWIDLRADALALPFPDGSVDAFICSHVLHHLPSPAAFFAGVARALRPGGLLLIQELEASVLLRLLQRLVRNEGWACGVDVFDAGRSCIPAGGGRWAANTAIPRLLFSSAERFERAFPAFRVARNEPCECLSFALSGGVLVEAPAPPLPRRALEALAAIDRLLIGAAPGLFALGRRVVLEKRAR